MSFQAFLRRFSRPLVHHHQALFSPPNFFAKLNAPCNLLVRNFASKKHKNLLKFAKGYRGRSKNCFSIAIRRVHKAWQYGFRDRKVKRREWRKLWIQRVQAGVRQYGQFNYSRFIPALAAANIQLNRKVLAEIAAKEPFAFKSVVDTVIAVEEQAKAAAAAAKTTLATVTTTTTRLQKNNNNNNTGRRIISQVPVQKKLQA